MRISDWSSDVCSSDLDALGNLARSFMQIDKNNKKIAYAASQIGDNIFDTPFKVRGKQDELGNAILKMRDSLQELSVNRETEIWIQTGLSYRKSVVSGKSVAVILVLVVRGSIKK